MTLLGREADEPPRMILNWSLVDHSGDIFFRFYSHSSAQIRRIGVGRNVGNQP
jgi:hypothetical protein